MQVLNPTSADTMVSYLDIQTEHYVSNGEIVQDQIASTFPFLLMTANFFSLKRK